MQKIVYKNVTIFFGDMVDAVPKKLNYDLIRDLEKRFADDLDARALAFVDQAHGIDGVKIGQENMHATLKTPADYMITVQKNIGLGILTADCLPIILFDPKKGALAVVHAGWRGACAGIAVRALENLRSAYASEPSDVQIVFGPCARACCYEVGEPVISVVKHHTQALIERDNKIFLDTIVYHKARLAGAGISAENMHDNSAVCTICNTNYCSYRRDGVNARRNLTLAILT